MADVDASEHDFKTMKSDSFKEENDDDIFEQVDPKKNTQGI